MMKMLKFAASMAMAIVLMSCGCSKNNSNDAEKEAEENARSAKGVAESFVKAIVQGKVDTAFAAYSKFVFDGSKTPRKRSNEDMRELKKNLEEEFKSINDDKLEVKAIKEVIAGGPNYIIVDGQKFTANATVTVQFIKGKDKKAEGITVRLLGGDETWKVIDYRKESSLDTSDNEQQVAPPTHSNTRPNTKVAYTKAATNSVKRAPDMGVSAPTKSNYGSSSKMRECESLFREFAEMARKNGNAVSEREIQEKIEEFRKLSSDEQDKALKEMREGLNMMRAAQNLKN